MLSDTESHCDKEVTPPLLAGSMFLSLSVFTPSLQRLLHSAPPWLASLMHPCFPPTLLSLLSPVGCYFLSLTANGPSDGNRREFACVVRWNGRTIKNMVYRFKLYTLRRAVDLRDMQCKQR